jgi:hypothetical protein
MLVALPIRASLTSILEADGFGADLSHMRDREAASTTLCKTSRYPTSNANEHPYN